MKKKALNIKQIKTDTKKLNVFRLTKKSNHIPTSCVVFPNGLCVEAPFVHHSDAFALGSNIYLAETDIDSHRATSDQLYVELDKLIENGILDLTIYNKKIKDRTRDMFVTSIFGYGSVLQNLKDEKFNKSKMDLISLVDSTVWIGSRMNWSKPNELIYQIAKNWLVKNGNIIWAYRVLYYIFTDDNFFEENSYTEFKKLLTHVNIHLPKKNQITTTKSPYTLEKKMTDCFAQNMTAEQFNNYQNIYYDVPNILSILECNETTNYLVQNFSKEYAITITKYDEYICKFMEKTLTPHQKKEYETLKRIQSGEINGILIDTKLNNQIPLSMHTLKSIFKNEKAQYLTINCIVPARTSLLKYSTIKPTLIENMVIDEFVTIQKEK